MTAAPFNILQSLHQKTVALPFRFGELQLFTLRFPAWVRDSALDFSARPHHGVPFEHLCPPVQAIVMGSDPVDQALPRITILPRAIRYVPSQYRRYYIDLAGSFQDYQKRLSSKRRYNLNREARVFSKASGGNIVWRTFRHPDEIEEFHRLASDISQKTYQQRLWDKGIPQTAPFRQHLKNAAARDAARGYILFFNDQPQAYAYFEARGSVLQFHYTGYDPALRRYSPGSVLLYKIVEQLIDQRQFHFLDFTEGDAWYKQSLATGHVRCADVYYFRRSWFGALTVAAHCTIASVSRHAALIAAKLHLKRALKRLLRRVPSSP